MPAWRTAWSVHAWGHLAGLGVPLAQQSVYPSIVAFVRHNSAARLLVSSLLVFTSRHPVVCR